MHTINHDRYFEANKEGKRFNEFSFSHYNCSKNLVQDPGAMWRIKGMENMLPMMYSVKAAK